MYGCEDEEGRFCSTVRLQGQWGILRTQLVAFHCYFTSSPSVEFMRTLLILSWSDNCVTAVSQNTFPLRRLRRRCICGIRGCDDLVQMCVSSRVLQGRLRNIGNTRRTALQGSVVHRCLGFRLPEIIGSCPTAATPLIALTPHSRPRDSLSTWTRWRARSTWRNTRSLWVQRSKIARIHW